MIKLSFEHDEVTAFLSLEVQGSLLVLFKGVDDLKEICLTEEEMEVFQVDFGLDLLDWDQECILIVVVLQGGLGEFLNSEVEKELDKLMKLTRIYGYL